MNADKEFYEIERDAFFKVINKAARFVESNPEHTDEFMTLRDLANSSANIARFDADNGYYDRAYKAAKKAHNYAIEYLHALQRAEDETEDENL